MDGAELARWTRFAGKGGIGTCTATEDCVAENAEDLMFLKDDEIVVLMQLPNTEDVYLGYCEGVVGRFMGAHVRFHARLKKPIMAKRSSTMSIKSPTPSAMLDRRESSLGTTDDTRLLVKSPSPLTESETSPVLPTFREAKYKTPSPDGEVLPNPVPRHHLDAVDETAAGDRAPRHHSTDDTLRNDTYDSKEESKKVPAIVEEHRTPNRHSTEETVVVISPPEESSNDALTRSPSPIMQRIREQLASDDSHEVEDFTPGEDSVVLSPSDHDHDSGDAGINIGLSLLQGSDDESEYSDDDEDDDDNSFASRTVEASNNTDEISFKIVSDDPPEEADVSDKASETHEIVDEVKSRRSTDTHDEVKSRRSNDTHDESKPRKSTDTHESKTRKSTDTYDPWGDIYDDYRYSVSTKSSASIYSNHPGNHSISNPFPSPLLHTRFGSSSSLELTPELPPEPTTPPTPNTPPLMIRKRPTTVGEGERTSLFLPHPGAPKPPPPQVPVPSPSQHSAPEPPTVQTGNNLIPIMRQVLSMGRPHPTIYGRTIGELWDAYGPIGITFSVDPPPLPPPPSLFAPRTSSPLRAPSSPGPGIVSSTSLRERPRSRSFSDLRLGAGMQTQTVKENTPTITTSRSMSNLAAGGTMDPAEVQEQRVSRVHVPEPIKVEAPARMGSFVPGAGESLSRSSSPLAPPSPRMLVPPSPRMMQSRPRMDSVTSSSSPLVAANAPSSPPQRGLLTTPSSPPKARTESAAPALGSQSNASPSNSPQMRPRANSTMSPPRPSGVANFVASNPSAQLSLLTQVPESRMVTPPPNPPPARALSLSPPPASERSTPPVTVREGSPSMRSMSPPQSMALNGNGHQQGSPSLGSMARVLSPPPNTAGPSNNMHRGSPSLNSSISLTHSPSLGSIALGRDSPVLGSLHPPSPTQAVSPTQNDTTQPSLRPLGAPGPGMRQRSLTLSPPPPVTSLRESPSPSPASLSSFPLPPFASSNLNGSPVTGSFPPGAGPGPSPPPITNSANRKLSLPNLRARTLSNRAGSMGGSNGPPRPSIDTESIRSGFSTSGVSVSVRSMEFEMITGQSSGGGTSPSSPAPRSSTNSSSAPAVPPTPTLPRPVPPPSQQHSSAPSTRSHTPTAPHVRDRETKFLTALSPSGAGSAKAKKKKLKKLVMEGNGVPMSVRWLVWMEMVAAPASGSGAAVVGGGQGMGGGLGGGGPGGRNAEALRALLDTVEGEGAERLKQAYRRMCPDVGWGEELDAVLPFLLTLAPEQDAFWIFCCIMDGSLRSYYTRAGDETTPQLEIDGELLARSLGKADSQLSHHLLTTLGLPAGKVIRGLGIRGAFVGKFRDPDDGEESIRRVWDNWLCESDGTPILIRTALTLLMHAPRREALLRVRKAEAAMNILARPIQIPPDEMAWRNSKWKINDEEVRRERQRMSKVLAEAHRKKAVRGAGSGGRGISLPTGAGRA